MSGPHRLRDGVRPCLLVFLAARIGLSLVSVIAVDLVEPLPPVDVPGRSAPVATSGWHNAIDATERQDAVWYLRLADDGWSGDDASAAFFPLYPLTVRAVAWILPDSWPGDELMAALLVSNVAFLGALLALFALTADAFGERVARRAIVVAALFPTAFFFLAPYTESLFLFLSILAFRAARWDRWGHVAVAGALAALTRSVGILLIPALLVEAFATKRGRSGSRRALAGRVAAAGAISLGQLSWLAWWGLAQGNWLAPFDAQRLWGRELQPPWVSLTHAVDLAWSFRSYWLLDLVLVSIAIAGLALAVPALRVSEITYGGLSLLLPLVDPFWDRPLLSAPRFAVVVFPALWGLSGVGLGRAIPRALVTAVLAGGWMLCAVLFVNWRHLF
ncbi:MAG: integral rane protein-like protein [Actinomycetia bacterium]|nr:integral rane protein-like protein [Actinomycetes bacterium]